MAVSGSKLDAFRKQYPAYDRVDDEELLAALHRKEGEGKTLDAYSQEMQQLGPRTGGLPSDPDFRVESGIFEGYPRSGYVVPFLKSVPRGVAVGGTSFAGGIAGILTPGTETGVERVIRDTENYFQTESIFAPRSKEEADLYASQLGQGLGSALTILGPGLVAKTLTAGATRLPGFWNAFKTPEALTSLGVATQMSGGEQWQRVHLAREQGIDVSAGQEFASIVGGNIVGVTEVLPMFHWLRGFSALNKVADPYVRGIIDIIKAGAREGTQEIAATLMQDAIETGVYNPNITLEDSWLGALEAGKVGLGVGGLIEILMKVVNRRNIGHTRTREREARQAELDALDAQRAADLEIERAREAEEPLAEQMLLDQAIEAELQEAMTAGEKSTVINRLTLEAASRLGKIYNGAAYVMGRHLFGDNLTSVDQRQIADFDSRIDHLLRYQRERRERKGLPVTEETETPITLVEQSAKRRKLPVKSTYTWAEARKMLLPNDFQKLVAATSASSINAIESTVEAELGDNRSSPTNFIPEDVPQQETLKVNDVDFVRAAADKNLELKVNSPAFRFFAKQFTGKTKDFTDKERLLLLNRIRGLPRFNNPATFPDYSPRKYGAVDFRNAVRLAQLRPNGVLTPKFLVDELGVTHIAARQLIQDMLDSGRGERAEGGRATFFKADPKVTNEIEYRAKLAREQGQPDAGETRAAFANRLQQTTTLTPEQIEEVTTANFAKQQLEAESLAAQEEAEEAEKVERPTIKTYAESARAQLEAVGLPEIGLSIYNSLHAPAAGEYIPSLMKIAIGLDRIDTNQTLVQQLDQVNGMVNHEIMHAVSALDLLTEKEWNALFRYAQRASPRMPDALTKDRRTFLQHARAKYPDLTESEQVEEAIAEAYRNWAMDRKAINKGSTRNLFQKIMDFLWGLFRGGVDARPIQEIFASIEGGEVGGRERGMGVAAPESEIIRRLRAAPVSEEAGQLLRPMMGGLPEDIVSTRIPTAVSATEDPLTESLTVGYDEVLRPEGESALEKNAAIISDWGNLSAAAAYESYKPSSRATTPRQVANRWMNHLADNLVFLYDAAPEVLRKRAIDWYNGANRIAGELAEKDGVPLRAAAGTIAATSPQNDWYINVAMAERIIDTFKNKLEGAGIPDAALVETMDRIYAKPRQAGMKAILLENSPSEIMAMPDMNQGAKESLIAMWIRAYDETYNPIEYKEFSPEGEYLGPVLKQDGSPAQMTWTDTDAIAKAVSMLMDPSIENISLKLGKGHKVRNFYNNIIDPDSDRGDVTIDTHAVAAATLTPVSGNSIETAHNFGQTPKPAGTAKGASSNAATGTNGMYPFYAEAYRRAAEQRGIQPREMQSVTWEAARSLFPSSWKSATNIGAVRDIWRDYKEGRISRPQARRRVLDYAKGIPEPGWARKPPAAGFDVIPEGADEPGQLPGAGLPGGVAGAVRPGIGGRVADTISEPAGGVAPGLRRKEMRAYHGTSQLFDRFDLTKIGTGEGFQAYGWGLYFSNSREVAEYYRDAVTKRMGGALPTNRPFVITTPTGGTYTFNKDTRWTDSQGWAENVVNIHEDLAAHFEGVQDISREEVEPLLSLLVSANGNVESLRQRRRDEIAEINRESERYDPWKQLADERDLPRIRAIIEEKSRQAQIKIQGVLDDKSRELQILEAIESDISDSEIAGAVYEVEIPEQEGMLDWNKPGREQSEYVKSTLQKAGIYDPDMRGQEIYYKSIPRETLAKDAPELASRTLNAMGIPGVTYIGHSSGARNFVIFDDAAIDIIEEEKSEAARTEEDPELQEAVDRAEEEAAGAPKGVYPRMNPEASPAALKAAYDFMDSGEKLKPEIPDSLRKKYMLTDEKQSSKLWVKWNPKHGFLKGMEPGKYLINFLENIGPNFKERFDSFSAAFRYEMITREEYFSRLEGLEEDRLGQYIMAESSALFAITQMDRARQFSAGAFSRGTVDFAQTDENDPLIGGAEVVDLIDPETGDKIDGLIGVIDPLMEYMGTGIEYQGETVNTLQLWASYVSAKRGKELIAEGKEVPKEMTPEAIDEIIEFGDNHAALNEAARLYQIWNNSIITFGEKTGILDPATAEEWRTSSTFFPFYRDLQLLEEESLGISPSEVVAKRRSTLRASSKTPFEVPMKGSEEKLNLNPMVSMAENANAIIYHGLQNIASRRALRQAEEQGMATPVMKGANEPPSLQQVTIRINGDKHVYEVEDPLLFMSWQSLGDRELPDYARYLGMPANLLRELVTRDPGFIVRNTIRDSMSAWVTSQASFVPFIQSFKNLLTADITEIENLGVVSGYDANLDRLKMGNYVEKLMRRQGRSPKNGAMDIALAAEKLWDWAGRGTTRSDAATRLAVFDDVLKQTGNRFEAARQGIEVINFGRRGAMPLFRVVTASIPFMNAKIQGLDVLYRAAIKGSYSAKRATAAYKGIHAPTPKQIVRGAMLRGGFIGLMTWLYWLIVHDTDEYKNASRYIRDNYFILPTPEGFPTFTIAKPFEVGFIYSTIPELVFDLIAGSTDQREFVDSMKRGIFTSLKLDPTRFQAFAPLLDIMNNRNNFTGKEIVPTYLRDRRESHLMYTDSTNELAKVIGDTGLARFFNVNPMALEYMLTGYGGTLGGYLMLTADAATRAMRGKNFIGSRADMTSAANWPVAKGFLRREHEVSGVLQEFYELRNELNIAIGTLNAYKEGNEVKKFIAHQHSREGLLIGEKGIRDIDQKLRKLREQRRAIFQDERLSTERRRAHLREIDEAIELLAPAIRMLREKADLPIRLGSGSG